MSRNAFMIKYRPAIAVTPIVPDDIDVPERVGPLVLLDLLLENAFRHLHDSTFTMNHPAFGLGQSQKFAERCFKPSSNSNHAAKGH